MLNQSNVFFLQVDLQCVALVIYVLNIEGYNNMLFYFSLQDGKFDVPIQAVLPQHNLSLPEHLHFGMCAAQDHVQLSFELNNTR